MISHSVSLVKSNRANNVANTVNDLEVSHKKQMSQLVQPSGEEAPNLSKQYSAGQEGHNQLLQREREEQEKHQRAIREEKALIARHHK